MAWPDRELPGAEGGAGTQPGVLTPAPSWPCPGCGRGWGGVQAACSVLALSGRKARPRLRPVPSRSVGCGTSRRTLAWWPRVVAAPGCAGPRCGSAGWPPLPQSVQKTPASPSSSGLWGPGSHPWPPSSTVCPLGVSRAARGQGRASGSLGSRCAVARSCPWNSAVPRAPRLACCPLQPPQKGPPQPWPSRRPFQGHHRSGDALRGSAALGGGWGRPRRGGGWRGRGLSPGWAGQGREAGRREPGPRAGEPCVRGGPAASCLPKPQRPAWHAEGAGWRQRRGRGPPVMGSTCPGAGLRGGPPASACLESPCLLLPGPLRGWRRGAGLVLSAGLFLPGSLVRNRPSRPPKQGSFSRTNNEAPRGVVTCPRSHRGSLGP